MDKFKFLIKKISNKLDYECAETDLVIYLIQLIKAIDTSKLLNKSDGAIVKYISTSLNRKSISLYNRNKKFNTETIKYSDNIKSRTSYLDTNEVELYLSLNCLNDVQKKIIIDKYLNNLTDTQIACNLGISRQSVYSNKVKALSKLKKYYL
ncbi:TPA: sigma-70 family RNA polymerase sigma factor [Clostridioides difficile]